MLLYLLIPADRWPIQSRRNEDFVSLQEKRTRVAMDEVTKQEVLDEQDKTKKRYFVTKITARRGWAIDQIRFEYRYVVDRQT